MSHFVFFAIMATPIPEPLCSGCWFGHAVSATHWIGTPTKPQTVNVDAAFERTLSRGDLGLDELVDRESAFLGEVEDRQLLGCKIL